MKLSKLAFSVVLGLAVSACSNQMSKDGSLEAAQQDYQNYEEITKQFSINEQWWRGYNDSQLNSLVDEAIANNLNLAKSAIAVNKALYNANLVGANLIPTFSGSGSASAAKGLGSSSNERSVGTSTITNTATFSLSYTVDLWRRLADTASAAEWEHKATIEDLKSTRLSLINSDPLAVEQAQQATLNARNNVISLRANLKVAEQTLRNLLNLKPNQPLPAKYPSILSVKLQGVDTNVPVSVIANRPDVTAALQRLQSQFNTLTATEKSWFPTLTLGASLSSSASKVRDVGDNPVGSGVISLSLPFLDWARVQNNIKVSEQNYLTTRANYEQTVTTALNEIDRYYYTYQQSRNSLATLQKVHEHNKKITQYYKNRYDAGLSEFRLWIAAMNTELNSQLSILNQKYTILTNENLVYQAMAGKYAR